MKNYLQLKNICKYYDNKIILKDISFSIDKSELVAVLGPSGCGKTTLLKIAAGFLEAEQGTVYKDGTEISGVGADRIMVFQEFRQLFPWKTVLDNVIFALQAKEIAENYSEREEIARHYLKRVELNEVFSHYPHQLSGGMKQRVALARTLAADPEIMLMDEPFGSLDSQTRSRLQKLLLDIWQEDQKTILFVTHDIEEAILLADRIVIMDKNPGCIKKIVDNNLSRPRDKAGIEFREMYKTIN